MLLLVVSSVPSTCVPSAGPVLSWGFCLGCSGVLDQTEKASVQNSWAWCHLKGKGGWCWGASGVRMVGEGQVQVRCE